MSPLDRLPQLARVHLNRGQHSFSDRSLGVLSGTMMTEALSYLPIIDRILTRARCYLPNSCLLRAIRGRDREVVRRCMPCFDG